MDAYSTKSSIEIYAFSVTITGTVDCTQATLTPPTVTNPPVYYYSGVQETFTVGSFTTSIPSCVIDLVTCSDRTTPAGFTGNFCTKIYSADYTIFSTTSFFNSVMSIQIIEAH